ncbi:MAG TPA: beta-ketoacyl synthase N-terminal-like domain-containing protein, partial [Gammaproteobacteria bacterium]|nr:beta-ketoacyl synthase N-terminal-like domain-containing protein [Gammaproteobacteria bacterium]
MSGAYIRGMGLSCALGEDVAHCVSAMQAMRVGPTALQLDGFDEPIQLPYYRIPDSAELLDGERCTHLLPSVVRAAVQQAGLDAAEIRKLPLFIGSSCFSIGRSESLYQAALAQHAETALPMPLCGYQDIGEIVRRTLGCAGDSWTYNTACTASANALLGAVHMIEWGWCRHALVVGMELANRTTLTGFSGLQLVSDAVRPFDAERKGMVFGEAIGAVLLSAQPGSGARIRVVGGANNCDTWSVTTANPDGDSVAAVLSTALERIKLQAGQVRGIKAHATGTLTGDIAEAHGLCRVFDKLPPVSVLKPFIGHTLGACGITELVLFATALQHGFLPAAPECETLDTTLGISPLTAPLPAPDGYYLLNQF